MADKRSFKARIGNISSISLLLAVVLALVATSGVFAQATTAPESAQVAIANAEVQKFGLIAAAIAFGMGAIGAGIAIANVGAAAMGAIGEKPEIAGQALIFIALAEGLVVFGFITALMILGKV
ncbi:MAG: ATPase [Spirochaetales bacterium]|nr:MAG: ATPase [Spirochaetales bacterium]